MREVDHRGILATLSAGEQIVDVLPTHEYNGAHIKSAIHIPLRKILREAPASLDRSRQVRGNAKAQRFHDCTLATED
jgi:rhodanese-related sulfurtransferase